MNSLCFNLNDTEIIPKIKLSFRLLYRKNVVWTLCEIIESYYCFLTPITVN